MGNNFWMFFPPRQSRRGSLPGSWLLAAADGRFEIQLIGGDAREESEFWALVTLTAIRRADGKLHGFAKITRDLTQQKLLELRQARLAIELEEL